MRRFLFVGSLLVAPACLCARREVAQPFLPSGANSQDNSQNQVPSLRQAANRQSTCKGALQSLIATAEKNNQSNFKPMTEDDKKSFIANALKAKLPNKVGINLSVEAITRTIDVFTKNQREINQQNYITIVDFTKKSNEPRMFVFDRNGNLVNALKTSHGHGSDPRGSGVPNDFSNKSGSHKSSAGCLLVGQKTGSASHGISQMLVGFEPGDNGNDKNCGRAVTMHSAAYVGDVPGRSWGCIAYNPNERSEIKKIQDPAGSLLCTYPAPSDLDKHGRFQRGD